MKWRKFLSAKRVVRAGVFTLCLGVYLGLLAYVDFNPTGLLEISLLLASCVLFDFLVRKLLRSKWLKRYFYDGGGSE